MIKPIEQVPLSALWEKDQRLLFDMAVKLNEVIVAVNDLVSTNSGSTTDVANPPSSEQLKERIKG